MSGRIQQYIEKLVRSRAEIFDEAGRKRALADQGAAAYGDAKRARVDGGTQPLAVPPLGPGPHTLADIFTLTSNPGLQCFDATQVPADLAAKITVRTLATLDQQILDLAVGVGFAHPLTGRHLLT
jgi:symplekin